MIHYLSIDWLGWMLVTVFLYWITPVAYRMRVLPVLTFCFLLAYSPVSAFILTFITLVSFFLSTVRPASSWRPLLGGFIVALTMIYFKLQVSISAFSDALPASISVFIIPLGLSYYSFRALHFLIERYRGHIVCDSFFLYIAYMFFLPTIVVGPIHRIREFLEDYTKGGWDATQLSGGLQRIVYGYAKISILSGYILPYAVKSIEAVLPSPDGALAIYVEMVDQGLNLYFLFSGYADIAIGFALLLGYRVMENFDYPYLKPNLGEFWRSWHISLTSWTRDYVYLPMLAITRRPHLAIVASFLVIAFWHEISLEFALWGLWHAVGIMVWQAYTKLKKKVFGRLGQNSSSGVSGAIKRSLGTLLTVHYFFASTIIIASSDLHEAGQKLGNLLFFWL